MILSLVLVAAAFHIESPALLASVKEAEARAEVWVQDPVCQVLFPAPSRALLTLKSQSYYSPTTNELMITCVETKSVALTPVGSSRVTICPAFARESLSWRAAVIIHEALHSSGVGEQTITSIQIQGLVLAFCDPVNRKTLMQVLQERKRGQ